MNRDTNDTRLQHAVARLREALPELQIVYLFGSSVSGMEHRESDVDLAVLPRRKLEPEMRWGLQEELAGLLHRDVDLVDLSAASTVMQLQVVSTGRLLYESSESIRHFFEMRVLSAYAMLNEERAGILEDIRRRGKIYG